MPLPIVFLLPWEGHPQGVPLPIVFSGRYALRRAPTRGAPTDCLFLALCPEKGAHKGCPYRLSFLAKDVMPLRRLCPPTRGAPTDCLFLAIGPEKGTHERRPYPILAASRGFVPI